VAVSGLNFPASTSLVFTFDTTPLTPTGSTQTDSSGSFSSVITIPSSATAEAHTITVTAGANEQNTTFTVTTSTLIPTSPLIISQNGDTIAIAHAGFVPNTKVTVKYDGVNVKEGNTDASGSFVITFKAPASIHGDHIVTAEDGTYIASANLIMESDAPIVSLSPAGGASVDSPVTFVWKVVTDSSSPVTYNLQIATSANFTADSILIDKIALTKSEYTLSEAEQLNLAGEATYYWRIKFVDAALNESNWTGAGSFTVSQPFKFSGWPLYLTIGAGAVVIFLFGLLIGRRSAFYY
jgi:hypothetical protein